VEISKQDVKESSLRGVERIKYGQFKILKELPLKQKPLKLITS